MEFLDSMIFSNFIIYFFPKSVDNSLSNASKQMLLELNCYKDRKMQKQLHLAPFSCNKQSVIRYIYIRPQKIARVPPGREFFEKSKEKGQKQFLSRWQHCPSTEHSFCPGGPTSRLCFTFPGIQIYETHCCTSFFKS